MKRYILFVLCVSTTILPLFDYDRAIHLAQKDQWQDAGTKLNRLVAQSPNSPELLYDAGVAAFNNDNFVQAKAYFEAATQQEKAPRELKEQAYFNNANTHVKLQEYKEALLSYEQALMLNSENELAKHNYEVVKRMLEHQEQQKQDNKDQQDQDQENQSQQNQQEKQQKQQESESQKSGSDAQGEKNESDQSDTSKDRSQDPQGNDQEQQDKHDQRDDDRFDHDGDKQDKQERGPNDQQKQPQQDEQRDGFGDAEQHSKEQEQRQQQKEQQSHESPRDEHTESQQQNKEEKEKEQGTEPVSDSVPLDPKLQQVLDKRSDRDAQLNKQLVKSFVNQMKGKDGQNCW